MTQEQVNALHQMSDEGARMIEEAAHFSITEKNKANEW
jgi:hypothetical protein